MKRVSIGIPSRGSSTITGALMRTDDRCSPPSRVEDSATEAAALSAVTAKASLDLRSWSHSADAAAALAMSRRGPYDVRPELLAWFAAQNARYEDLATEFVALRVAIYAGRRGIEVTDETLKAATVDAIEKVRTRKTAPAAERAKALGVRKSAFLDLRNAGVRFLASAIAAGRRNFIAATAREPAPPGFRHAENGKAKNVRRAHKPETPMESPLPEIEIEASGFAALRESISAGHDISDWNLEQRDDGYAGLGFRMSDGAVIRLELPPPLPVFVGSYVDDGFVYRAFHFIKHEAEFWIALRDTTVRPGADDSWDRLTLPSPDEEKQLARLWMRLVAGLVNGLLGASK